MKKKLIAFFILITFLILNSTISIGASSITYLYLDAIKIDNSNIEILSNELSIDTTKSKIKNTIKLKNTSNKEIETNLAIPLENKELNISIKNLVIKLNGVKVEYVKSDDGVYTVKTRISANSGKKINIEYYTENDLQKAKIIKCNFDNLKGKKVGKLKVDIKIDDKNIPLVEKIYPGHYTFKDNTISVEYYNYEVNTITKNIIVKKETFNNLLYGRESNLDNEERDIIKAWYTKGDIKEKDDYYEDPIVQNIIDYKKIKNGLETVYGSSEPLLYEMDEINPYPNDDEEQELKGKNICIDFVETEDGKDLYVDKVVDVKNAETDEMQIINDLVKTPERTILQTNAGEGIKRGAKIIFVGQGIDGENLNATEQEKISYINQINADMYIRIEIYDGTIKYKTEEDGYKSRIGNGMVGYYDNNNSEIAKAFALCEYDKLTDEELYSNSYYEPYYSNYEDYVKNYYNDYYKDCVIKLENKDITNKCEVPTVIQFIGNRVKEKGKYVVEYFENAGFYDSFDRGLITTNAALQTSQAKKMLAANKQKNANIKAEVESKINNLSIVDDEQKIQKNIKDELEELKEQEELKEANAGEEGQKNETKEQQKILNKHIMIFTGIGLGIAFCIVIIIIEQKKKIKREDNNGGKETNKN